MKVDLNCDLGESFGAYTIGLDKEVIAQISSANVACGFHASDPNVMDLTVGLCKEHRVRVGAHPGYPDLLGFGRRAMAVSPAEIRNYIIYQVGALQGFCAAHGIRMQHVKPHGALYNTANKDLALSKAICEGIAAVNPELILLGLPGGVTQKAAEETGLAYACEVFADRGYQADGSLVPRSQPGALIKDEDEMIARVLQMVKDGTVTAVTGETVSLRADSICVHGDGEKAVAFVRRIREELTAAGVTICSIEEVIRP